MPNQLEQLNAFSNIAIETANVQSIPAATNNLIITSKEILKLVKQQTKLLQDAVVDIRKQHWSSYSPTPKAVGSQLTINLLKTAVSKISGYVFIELDAELSFDPDGLVNQAQELHDRCRDQQVDSSRIVVTFPATWQGIQAVRQLRRNRVNTNLSLVYSFIQAQACGDAGAFMLSMPVNAATQWYKHNEPDAGSTDAGVLTAAHAHNNLKYLGYTTKIMATGFGDLAQLREMAGCDYLSVTPAQIQQLNQEQAPLERKLNKAPEVFERPPEVTEKDFHWYLTSNAMAYSQLGNDIRALVNEQRELEDFIKQTIEAENNAEVL